MNGQTSSYQTDALSKTAPIVKWVCACRLMLMHVGAVGVCFGVAPKEGPGAANSHWRRSANANTEAPRKATDQEGDQRLASSFIQIATALLRTNDQEAKGPAESSDSDGLEFEFCC